MSFIGPRPVMNVSFQAYPKHQDSIYNVKPGLSGIGSIIFRDEEDIISEIKEKGGNVFEFYQKSIYPYKGKLELWYQDNMSFKTDFMLILITMWVVIFPESNILKKIFPNLPEKSF